MILMDYNSLCRLIHRSLPGETRWMQCVPRRESGEPAEEGVGLAINREAGPKGSWYLVVFFRVVPEQSATDDDGEFLPGRGEDPEDWSVRVGYTGDHDTLADAVDEARDLAKHLPRPAFFKTEAHQAAILGSLEELQEDPAA